MKTFDYICQMRDDRQLKIVMQGMTRGRLTQKLRGDTQWTGITLQEVWIANNQQTWKETVYKKLHVSTVQEDCQIEKEQFYRIISADLAAT